MRASVCLGEIAVAQVQAAVRQALAEAAPRERPDLASRRFTWLYARSQVQLKYRYTSLGFLWNVLEPALFLGVLSLVFSVVNRMSIADYAVFLFSALVPWRYFEKVVNTCMDSIVQGDWLLKKLPVSPFALPLSRWMLASVEFGFSFAVVLALLTALHHRWTVHFLALPLAALLWSLAGLGAGLLAAVLFTFFRDVRPLVQLLLMFAFFSAPILFKPVFPAGRCRPRSWPGTRSPTWRRCSRSRSTGRAGPTPDWRSRPSRPRRPWRGRGGLGAARAAVLLRVTP
jgi:ABC-type polysaccharide/polyol phosphate export permease